MSAKEAADDSDKEAPTSGSSFERTITVVKGNSSLGLCSFLPVLSLHFSVLYYRLASARVRLNAAAAFTLVPRFCETKSWIPFSFFPPLHFKASPWEHS